MRSLNKYCCCCVWQVCDVAIAVTNVPGWLFKKNESHIHYSVLYNCLHIMSFHYFYPGGNVVRGGVFSYTAPVYSVALEASLLHALTLTGLETYTLRPHPFVVVSHLPEGLNMVVSIGKFCCCLNLLEFRINIIHHCNYIWPKSCLCLYCGLIFKLLRDWEGQK